MISIWEWIPGAKIGYHITVYYTPGTYPGYYTSCVPFLPAYKIDSAEAELVFNTNKH